MFYFQILCFVVNVYFFRQQRARSSWQFLPFPWQWQSMFMQLLRWFQASSSYRCMLFVVVILFFISEFFETWKKLYNTWYPRPSLFPSVFPYLPALSGVSSRGLPCLATSRIRKDLQVELPLERELLYQETTALEFV